MITVSVFINGNPIYTRSAVNISENYGVDKQTYRLDTGELLKHNYTDGAVKLAIAMLKTVQEV